ncbi:hypothetical protein ACIROD_23790 [Peribacillus sp. NPDC101481]|jgi:hypothetical protein|uniref:hypothetical protein n=1 Tax=Peribacillus sp. NPDC101481 TaxID=3364403 RepID=UPI003802545E
MFFTVILIVWKKIETLLPKGWLVKTPQALALMRLGRQLAERGRKGGGVLKSIGTLLK